MTGPVSFTVALIAGPLDWIVRDNSDSVYGLKDGLQLIRSTPDGDLSPGQPNPAVLKFGIIAESVDDVIPALDIGDKVALGVWFPRLGSGDTTTLPSERFAGRISDLEVVPHPRGVLVNVTAVDYLADLAEQPDYDASTTSGVWLTASALDWVFDRYGMDTPPRLAIDGHTYSGTGPDTWFIKTGTLPEVIEGYLRQWVIGFDFGALAVRYVLAPKLGPDRTDPDLDAIDPYVLLPVAVPAHQRAYRDVYPIAASRVDVNGTFNRTKADAVTALDVTYYDVADEDGGEPGDSSVATAGSGNVRAQLETMLSDPAAAAFTASLLLPSADADWRIDSFTWHLKNEPAGTYLPNPEPSIPGAYLGGPVDIVGLDSRWSPIGTTYQGILAGYTLILERARPRIDLDLRDALT